VILASLEPHTRANASLKAQDVRSSVAYALGLGSGQEPKDVQVCEHVGGDRYLGPP
jgi:hypothetical protein